MFHLVCQYESGIIDPALFSSISLKACIEHAEEREEIGQCSVFGHDPWVELTPKWRAEIDPHGQDAVPYLVLSTKEYRRVLIQTLANVAHLMDAIKEETREEDLWLTHYHGNHKHYMDVLTALQELDEAPF